MHPIRPVFMENERAKIRVPTHLDAILVMELSFIPGRCGHLECNGADCAFDWQHHLLVIVGSDVEDVVHSSLAAWPEASEDRNQPSDTPIFNVREREHRALRASFDSWNW
jgi:hypothetical protein